MSEKARMNSELIEENALLRQRIRMLEESGSARKQVGEALYESEALFADIFSNSPVAISIIRLKDDRIIGVNSAWQKVTGYSREEAVSHDMVETECWDEPRQRDKIISNLREKGIVKEFLFRIRHKSGKIFDMLGSASLIETNAEQYVLSLAQDITALKNAEESLKKSEEQIRILLNSTAEAIYGIDLQGNCTFTNSSCLKMLGYLNPNDILGKNMHNLIHHSYPDGRLMPVEECSIYKAFHKGTGMHRDDEVLWKADGTSFSVEYWSYPQIVNGEVIGAVVTFNDITERKEAERKIKYLATHDALTDLPSLRLAKDRLCLSLSLARRHKSTVAIMFVDLDGFKAVNDTLGHDAGDYVLKQVADRMLSCVRETDTVARVGGDEFLLIAAEIHTPENVADIARKIIHFVSLPITIKGQETAVGASIGIALYPDHGEDMDQLIKQADEAMYRVKNAGKNGFAFVNTTLK